MHRRSFLSLAALVGGGVALDRLTVGALAQTQAPAPPAGPPMPEAVVPDRVWQSNRKPEPTVAQKRA